MTTLNAEAAAQLREHEPHAVTDVTGFGLVGHARELAAGAGLRASIQYDRIPLLPEVRQLVVEGFVPGGTRTNLELAVRLRDVRRLAGRVRPAAGLRRADLRRPARGASAGRRGAARVADRGGAGRRGAGNRAGRLTGAVAILFSFTQMLLAVILIVLVLMHSGKDTGLSGMFNPGQSQFGGTAVMERNLTRLTIVVSVLFAINGVILGFVL